MSRASIELEDLERGTWAGQAPPVVHEAATPGTDQNDGGGSNLEGSAPVMTSHAAVEDGVDPGE